MLSTRAARAAWWVVWGVVAVVAGCGAPESRRDVSYDPRHGEAGMMDVYSPGGPGPHPGIMLIHGGGWRAGSRGAYTDAAKRLARSGYVAATIEYRLVGEGGGYPGTVQDCMCALAHLRAHAAEYGLDPQRVAVMGYSAGGHLAGLLGVGSAAPVHQPDCAAGTTGPPNAVIVGAGATDLRGRDHSWVREFIGGTEAERPEAYASASPITYVGPNKPPYLFVSGNADWFVDLDDNGYVMQRALAAAGNDARVLQVTGGGHLLNATTDNGGLMLGTSEVTPEAWIAIIDFLDRTVGR